MSIDQKIILPNLPYGLGELAPFMSEKQLSLHYQKHHQAYVNSANAVLEKLAKARSEEAEIDVKSALKELSFQIGGHILHSLFWENLAPSGRGGGSEPSGFLADLINSNFGSLKRFKKEFSLCAQTVEGSGWAALASCPKTERLLLVQIEKHNVNIIPNYKIILVLDVFEHAYYLDYKNDRAAYIESFWQIVNWQKAGERLK